MYTVVSDTEIVEQLKDVHDVDFCGMITAAIRQNRI